MPLSLSPKQLRRCYGRAMLCCLLIVAFTMLLSRLLPSFYVLVLEPLLWLSGLPVSDHVVNIVLNDVVAYLPVLLAIPMTVGLNPKLSPAPVRPLPKKELLRAIPFCVGVLYLLAMGTDVVIGALEQVTGQETSNVLETMLDFPVWVYFVSAVVVAPICEELLFRKLFLNRCRVLGDASAILLSAAAFGLMHENLYQLFYAFGVGVCLGCVALMTGRLRECILIHACVNSVSFLAMLSADMLWQTTLSLLVVVCMAYAVYLFAKRWRGYRFDPGPLPYTPEEKRHACASSPCFWICGALCLIESTAVIFMSY